MSGLNWGAFLMGYAALQGLFLALALALSKRGRPAANHLLALLMLVFAAILLDSFLHRGGLYHALPALTFFSGPLWFLPAPLILWYTASRTGAKPSLARHAVIQLLPAALVLYRSLEFYALSPAIKLRIADTFQPYGTVSTEAILFVIQNALLLPWALRLLRNSRNPSDSSPGLAWLRVMIIALLIYAFLDFACVVGMALLDTTLPGFSLLTLGVLTILLHGIGLLAILDPEQLFPPALLPRARYARSGLRTEELPALRQRLDTLLLEGELYLQDNLQRGELALSLGIPEYQLSQLLNQHIGMGFHDYLNHCRIEAFKIRLAAPDSDRLTILALAYELGFSSKGSFYRAFRKHVGLTPSEYARQSGQRSKPTG